MKNISVEPVYRSSSRSSTRSSTYSSTATAAAGFINPNSYAPALLGKVRCNRTMSDNENSGLKITSVKGPAARRTGIPIDEMELQRVEAIRKRESLACSWAENQEPADLIALLSENANEYGFLWHIPAMRRFWKQCLSAAWQTHWRHCTI